MDIKVTHFFQKKKKGKNLELWCAGEKLVTRMDIKVTLTKYKKKIPNNILYINWKPRSEAEPQ